MEIKKEEKRIDYIDFMKAILIFLVVLGHAIQLFNGKEYRADEMYYENILYRIIYSFHMPMFMLISGYLYCYSEKNSVDSCVFLSKIFYSVIPIITFSFYKTICCDANLDIAYFIKQLLYNFIHTLWFIWSLIWAKLFLRLYNIKIRYFQKKIYKGTIMLIMTMFIFFFPDILLADVYKFTIPFFLVGYFINKYGLLSMRISPPKAMYLPFVIWGVMLLFFHKEKYIYTSGVSLINLNIKNMFYKFLCIDIYRYCVGMFGSITFYYFIIFMHNIFMNYNFLKRIKKVLENRLGKHSLEIYILTTEVFNEKIYMIYRDCNYSFFRCLFISVFLIVLCCILYTLINKFKYLKLIIWGKR